MMNKNIFVKDIVHFLGNDALSVYGAVADVFVDNVADLEHTNPTTLDWINVSKDNKKELVLKSPAKVFIVDPSLEYDSDIQEAQKILISVEKPRMVMAKVITEFFLPKPKPSIHPSAVISKEAEIGSDVYIGAGCVIGKAKIGKNTVLQPNVVVYDDVTIGNNCLIQAGAIIGTDGLGCMREPDGKMIKFPHIGGIVICDNVEIGANCQVAKGVLSDTIIKNGCKINGLCFIAHNCILEENVWITGDTMLCGSVKVGKNTTIFSNVIVRDGVHIGEQVTIGMGSVVTKNIPDKETWLGAPAHKK